MLIFVNNIAFDVNLSEVNVRTYEEKYAIKAENMHERDVRSRNGIRPQAGEILKLN